MESEQHYIRHFFFRGYPRKFVEYNVKLPTSASQDYLPAWESYQSLHKLLIMLNVTQTANSR